MTAVALRAQLSEHKIILDWTFTQRREVASAEDRFEQQREAWLLFSRAGLARAYAEDEEEYSLDSIIEANPDYERR